MCVRVWKGICRRNGHLSPNFQLDRSHNRDQDLGISVIWELCVGKMFNSEHFVSVGTGDAYGFYLRHQGTRQMYRQPQFFLFWADLIWAPAWEPGRPHWAWSLATQQVFWAGTSLHRSCSAGAEEPWVVCPCPSSPANLCEQAFAFLRPRDSEWVNHLWGVGGFLLMLCHKKTQWCIKHHLLNLCVSHLSIPNNASLDGLNKTVFIPWEGSSVGHSVVTWRQEEFSEAA